MSALDKFQQRYPDRPLASPFDDLITDLQTQVGHQYLHVDTVIQPLATDSASSTMQTKHDPNGQLLVEMTTTTPVACGLHDAIGMLTAGMAVKERRGQKTFLDVRAFIQTFILRSMSDPAPNH